MIRGFVHPRSWVRAAAVAALLLAGLYLLGLLYASPAHALALMNPLEPTDPTAPLDPADPGTGGANLTINGLAGTPSSSIVTLLAVTLLSVAPALLLMMTSFTKIFVVLAMTRNAIGLPTIPPNQVLAGLALFLSLFIMSPTLVEINNTAVQPFLDGSIDINRAFELAGTPLRNFDLVVASALMSMGMMMLPPVMISLPFKILLFILVDGWGLVITSLIGSYAGGP